jgi:hypothetical protein
MSFKFFLFALALAVVATAVQASLGFGASRLKNYHSQMNDRKYHKLSLEASTCDNVTELYFSGAVIDNFSPIQNQLHWYGKGQRYYLNKQFWGGNDDINI